MFKRLVFSFLTALVLLTFAAPSVHAQISPWYVGEWYNQGPVQWHSKVYDNSNPQEIFGERYTAAQVQWIIYSLFSVALHTFISPDVIVCFTTRDALGACPAAAQDIIQRLLGVDPPTALNPNDPTMAVQPEPHDSLASAILDERPISGISYVRGKVTNFHVVPEAHAQTGFGYTAFTFIQGLWGATRNITYGLMILVVIVMAFMIMFRTKISPQAVITVQSALPRVIMTLILITFSYAIAGFAVDLMYVTLGLISLIFTTGSGVFDNTPAGLFDQLTVGNMGLGLLGTFILYWFRFFAALIGILLTPGGLFAGLVSLTSAPMIVTIGMTLVSITLAIVIFKALWVLVKTFINIILLVIASPILIALGALSPNSGGFKSWIKNLAAELAVYPGVAVLTLISFVFLAAAFGQGPTSVLPFDWGIQTWMFGVNSNLFTTQNAWAPPLTFGPNGMGLRLLWLFASLGALGLIPRVSEIIKSYVSGKPFAYGSAIGAAFTVPGLGMGKAGLQAGIGGGLAGAAGYLLTPRPAGSGSRGGLGTAARSGAEAAIKRAFKIGQ